MSPYDHNPTFGLRPVTAVLGPTNTGKTHYALDRMAAHESGMIGLPLRLLAREVYDRMVARKSPREVALVTGEEKIIPTNAKYWVCTVEAMPLEQEVAFLAIDEIQLAADYERGRIFTERLLFARGSAETLLLGSDTMAPILRRLIPDIGFVSRDRFSRLDYGGPKKVTRLPRRTAIVAFSADAVYSIAELIRRQRGGAAVIMGALSPRTRNAQAELYHSGEVDYLVATDAIGMGLNMDIDHVAFAARHKFDGRASRRLFPAEMAQIAGRAGRHIKDGTFGTTAECPALEVELVEQIENHQFEPVRALQWRSTQLEFNTLPALLNTLEQKAPRRELQRCRPADDEQALRKLISFFDIKDMAKGGAALRLLWDVCQIPDFRKVTLDQHTNMLADIYRQIINTGTMDENWITRQVERLDRSEGDVDALSHRISHVRTWTYLSHRAHWLKNASYWQERARAIEDKLSDALHEKLTQRFIDRRTSVLLKKLKDDAPLLAGVTATGDVIVEGEFVGRLLGFQFILDPKTQGPHQKPVRHAALKALTPELAARAGALANAQDKDLVLRDGSIWWRDAVIAKLKKGPLPLRPDFTLVAMEHLPTHMLPRIEDRVRDFFAAKLEGVLLPLMSLQKAINLESGADDALDSKTRGVAYRLVENFGAVTRAPIAGEIKALDQTERSKLRKAGVRFGEFALFLPALLKPAPSQMLALLWSLWNDQDPEAFTPPNSGLTSIANNKDIPAGLYFACGYRPSGTRAVRLDMLERLAEMVRKARGDADMREGFEVHSNMMSIVGCSGEEFEGILTSLGYKKNIVRR
ncbi:MAG: DEAD/DEAH box helicase, partial [Parvularculaceae bacterium]